MPNRNSKKVREGNQKAENFVGNASSASWAVLGILIVDLGASWRRLGGILGRLGGVLGRFGRA